MFIFFFIFSLFFIFPLTLLLTVGLLLAIRFRRGAGLAVRFGLLVGWVICEIVPQRLQEPFVLVIFICRRYIAVPVAELAQPF